MEATFRDLSADSIRYRERLRIAYNAIRLFRWPLLTPNLRRCPTFR